MLYGQQFAAGPGVTTILAHMDFETKSLAGYLFKLDGKLASLPGLSDQKRGLKATGVRPYVEHPSFIPLMLAYNLNDGTGPKQWEWGQSFDVLQPLFDHIKAGKLVEAHNVGFEWEVWDWCVEHLGWPPLQLEQLRCSAAKSRANAYPGALADVGKVTNIEHQKDPAGDKLMKLFSIPRNPSKKDPRYFTMPYDAPEEWAAYKAYNMRDIEAESEVSIKSPDLSAFELQVWMCDMRINKRGIQVDIEAVENCIAIVEQAYAKYGVEIRSITGGIEATELKQLQGWLAGQAIHMGGMTEEDVAAMLSRLEAFAQENGGDLHEFASAYRVLELRSMLSSASVKKLYALRASVDKHGRVHDLYIYHAARTGRVIGQGVQPTNLYKGTWNNIADIDAALGVIASRCLELVEYTYPKLSALDVVNNCLRSLFIAAPGKVLISSDYSAIEGVVAAGLAGCEWRLDVFRTHGMIYEASAANICKIPFEDFVQHRISTGAEVTRVDGKVVAIKGGKHHPMRNKIGKFAELACFGGNTKVLTSRGYVAMVDVSDSDMLWDGHQWVNHGGVLEKGERETLLLDGVRMTPDHLISLGDCWREAVQLVLNPATLSRALAIGSENLPFSEKPLGWGKEVFKSYSDVATSLRRVYDIAHAGPRNRFTIRTNSGHLIVHNCGFGGWIGAMKGFGADEFLDEGEMKNAVLGFRDASPEFPEMWGGQSRGRFQDAREELFGLEGCIVNAIKNPGLAYYCRGIGYQMHGDVLYCLLPSGRMLTYHEPRLGPSSRPYSNPWEYEITYSGWNSNPMAGEMGWVRIKIYGGKAFENVVQAVARDIQAHAIVKLEAAGYPVVMQTYDEAVSEVGLHEGKSVEEMEDIMMDVPDWARAWPIKAKGGWLCHRYGKFE